MGHGLRNFGITMMAMALYQNAYQPVKPSSFSKNNFLEAIALHKKNVKKGKKNARKKK